MAKYLVTDYLRERRVPRSPLQASQVPSWLSSRPLLRPFREGPAEATARLRVGAFPSAAETTLHPKSPTSESGASSLGVGSPSQPRPSREALGEAPERTDHVAKEKGAEVTDRESSHGVSGSVGLSQPPCSVPALRGLSCPQSSNDNHPTGHPEGRGARSRAAQKRELSQPAWSLVKKCTGRRSYGTVSL